MPSVARRERWMAALFAVGSLCFLVGPFPGYAELVGAAADALTFFVGSIFFTARRRAADLARLARRRARRRARGWWRSAIVQSAGTLFFNVTTFRALNTALVEPALRPAGLAPGRVRLDLLPRLRRDRLRASRGAAGPERGPGWWQPAVNLLGCVFFGISAVAGYVVPVEGLDARPRRPQLEHVARRGLLPRLRARGPGRLASGACTAGCRGTARTRLRLPRQRSS